MRDDEDEEESGPPLSITTWRLELRPPEAGDTATLAVLAADPHVGESLTASPLARPGEPGESFAILARRSHGLLGGAAYGPVSDGRRQATEIAVWIAEPHWGRGYGTEATQALIDRAFADERVTVLWCANRVTNTRARRVVEKCGFQFRETGMVRPSATRGAIPVERFVLERRNWVSLKSWGARPQPEGGRDAGEFAA